MMIRIKERGGVNWGCVGVLVVLAGGLAGTAAIGWVIYDQIKHMMPWGG